MTGQVLIVGGGVAGLTAAIALSLKGYVPTVVELYGKPHGSGLGFGERALEALDDLGAAMPLLAHSTIEDRMFFRDREGKEINQTPYPRSHRAHLPAHVTMSRASLSHVLSTRAAALEVDVRVGVTWSELEQEPAGVAALLTDGTRARYDFVVAADGAYSKTREQIMGGPVALEFLGQGAWRWLAPWASSQPPAGCTYMSPDVKMGIYPLTDNEVYLFATQNFATKPWMDERRLGELFSEVLRGFDVPLIQEYRNLINGSDNITFRPLEAFMMPDPWAKGRIVAIGDAAHTLSPHLGSGAAMAIEDAWVLADCVATHAGWESALREFMARRYRRTRLVYEASNSLCSWDSTEEFARRRAQARAVLEEPL